MILILTEPNDAHARIVANKLSRRGAHFLWFDPAQFPAQAQITLGYRSGGSTSGKIVLPLDSLDFSEVTAAWYRRPGLPVAHGHITNEAVRGHVERESQIFLREVWHRMRCLWVPAPVTELLRAEHKTIQLQIATDLGFEIPPTIITNSPADFLEFYRSHNGEVVSKAFYYSSLNLRGKNAWEDHWIYTKPVYIEDIGYASSVRYCPVIFQAYVPKRLELRITVVGRKVFAAQIDSQYTHHTRHDWRRYDYRHTPHKAYMLPLKIQRLCIQLVEQLGLCFGAIDMVLTPDGRYVFLEINPNGQYAWIEDLTKLPISDAVCDLLVSRESANHSPKAEKGVTGE